MREILLALYFVGGSFAFAVIGVLLGRMLMHRHVAEGHNDVLVPTFLTAGVIYAVLLGFTVVAVWESYDAARANVSEEASLLVPLYRQTTVMNDDKGGEMRELIHAYAEHTVEGWDSFRAGVRNSKAGHDVNEIFRVFGTMAPATKARELVAAQFLATFSQIVLDRNKRQVHASEALSWIMWLAIIGGGVLTVGMSFFIYMERTWPHVLGVTLMAVLIGMLLFIVAMLSQPFHGPMAIKPEPFERTLVNFGHVGQGN